MASIKKIAGVTALVAIVSGLIFEGTKAITKATKAADNIIPKVSFKRIHGLVGSLLSPTVRVVLNLNLKNFSGYDLAVQKVFIRVEALKQGEKTYSPIATSSSYLDITVPDGKPIDKEIIIDFNGLDTILSSINKTTKHRVVINYVFKGVSLSSVEALDITSPLNSFWNKLTGKKQSKNLTGLDLIA